MAATATPRRRGAWLLGTLKQQSGIVVKDLHGSAQHHLVALNAIGLRRGLMSPIQIFYPQDQTMSSVIISSSMRFPRMYVVRQNFPDRRIHDVAGEVKKQLAGSPFSSRLKPGSRVAIGVVELRVRAP